MNSTRGKTSLTDILAAISSTRWRLCTRSVSEYMRSVSDITSATLFETILADEETHVDYLETQLALLEKLGEPLYIAGLIEQPS